MGNTEVFVMGQKENQSFGEVVYEDPMTEIKLLFAATGIGLLVLIISNVLVMIYVGISLSEMNCTLKIAICSTTARRRDAPVFARRYRLTLITALLRKRPLRLLLDNPSSLEDVRLPLDLRRWVEIPYRLNAFSLLGILALYGWAEYLGLFE
jgi:hypothetical protein